MKLHSTLVNLGDFCKRNHQQLVAGLITFSLSLCVLGLRESGSFKEVELWVYDSLTRSQLNEPPDRRVVIVEISEADIRDLGALQKPQPPWPLSDRVFAKLINQISVAKPAVIGIDKYLDYAVTNSLRPSITA